MFTAHYQSPLGEILLAADEVGLTGLWFDRAKYYAAGLAPQSTERETPPLTEAKRWLDVYFSGKMPDFMPPLHPIGSDFRQKVWALLLQIPYHQDSSPVVFLRQQPAPHQLLPAHYLCDNHMVCVPCYSILSISSKPHFSLKISSDLLFTIMESTYSKK